MTHLAMSKRCSPLTHPLPVSQVLLLLCACRFDLTNVGIGIILGMVRDTPHGLMRLPFPVPPSCCLVLLMPGTPLRLMLPYCLPAGAGVFVTTGTVANGYSGCASLSVHAVVSA